MMLDKQYLVSQIAPLQSCVGTDALVDGPCKLIVQLPCFEGENESSDSHQHGQSDEHRLDVVPEVLGDEAARVEVVGSVLDLVELDGRVDENADVVQNETDDLNGVLHAQGIPCKEELVDIAEHEDGEESGNRAGLVGACTRGREMDLILELAKDISDGVLAGAWW